MLQRVKSSFPSSTSFKNARPFPRHLLARLDDQESNNVPHIISYHRAVHVAFLDSKKIGLCFIASNKLARFIFLVTYSMLAIFSLYFRLYPNKSILKRGDWTVKKKVYVKPKFFCYSASSMPLCQTEFTVCRNTLILFASPSMYSK